MSVLIGSTVGLVLGSIVGYLLILGKKNVNSKLLDTLKTDLTESESKSIKNKVAVESDSERLALFNIKDTKNLPLNISEQDKEYLLTEFIKANKQLVPYGNVIDGKDYLYPTMNFRVCLNTKGNLYHDVKGIHRPYGFTLAYNDFKELSKSIHSDCYELSLTGGPYRVSNQEQGGYTEFKDNPLTVFIEVPLNSFIKTK